MSQPAAATAVPSHWVADWVVGIAGALSAFAVAQAAIPREDAGALARSAPVLRGVHQVNMATVDTPDFVYGEPVAGYEVVSPFGMRKLPWEAAGRLHAGVDIAAPSGYPVQATADGVVTYAGYKSGYGQMVEIAHAQGLKSVYAHLGAVAVKPGMAVRAGDPLGQVGNTGSSTGAHLHFEVRDAKARPLNPEAFIGQAFATAHDLPLKQAARAPRGMRIAHVSYIPKPKRELMERRAADEAMKAALEAGLDPKAAAEAALKAGTPAPLVIKTRPLYQAQHVRLTPDSAKRIAQEMPDAWKTSTVTMTPTEDIPGWSDQNADAPMSTY